MTVAAGQFALFASRDWNAAGLIMAGGIALDICREVIDRMLGRPTASAIWDANIWTTNAAFMRRQRILSYSFISLVFVSLQIVAMYFSLDRVPAQREIDVGVANSIARQVLDLSTLLRSTPDLADTRDLRSPDRAVIIVRSLSVLLVVSTLFIFIGILAIARPIAILNEASARKKSEKSYSDQAVLVAIYIFMCMLLAFAVFIFNRLDIIVCTVKLKDCKESASAISMYVAMLAYFVLNTVIMASTVESGCRGRTSSNK